ncbi:MAG: hypothetical protein NVS3B5_11800 [Sphingomicrobium sp.]
MWKDAPQRSQYERLIAFRDAHRALWNAPWGARMIQVVNSEPAKLFSFVRAKGGDAVLVAQNYSGTALTATLNQIPYGGEWREEGGAALRLDNGTRLTIAPWSSRIFTRKF